MVAPTILLTVDNPVFRTYLFYCCVLAAKMIAMSYLTGITRFKKLVFSSPEDVRFMSVFKRAKLKFDDEDVERVRRAHLNDLENIPIFLIVSLVYIATDPVPWVANNVFRVFTAGRIVHTICYAVFPMPQPVRGIAYEVSSIATIFMIYQGLKAFMV